MTTLNITTVGFLPLLFMLFIPDAFAAAMEDQPLLDEIRFSGNVVTRESVMLQEMVVKEGQPYSPQQVEKSRLALMNMGLFSSVQIEPLQEEGKQVLLVKVEERYFFLPLPLLDYRPRFLADETANNYSYGGELRFDNLFGLNQRLKLSYKEKKYVDDVEPSVKRTDLLYIYPHVVGTPYHLDFRFGTSETSIVDYVGSTVVSKVSQKEQYGSIVISRWFNPEGISEGWRAGMGIAAITTDYALIQGGSNYDNHDDYALIGSVGYHMVNQYRYHRSGYEYLYSMQMANRATTSDSEYFRNTFSYRRYQPLKEVDANINSQFVIGVAFGDEPAYSLGNSTSLRGYDSDSIEGNFLLQGNIEYHHHVSGYRQLRGVLFFDAANVWPEVSEVNEKRLYTSGGIGLRWRLQSFVDITLRVDHAYNTQTGESRTYLATTGSF